MPREALKKLDGLAKTFENDYPSTEKGYQEMKKHREGLTATIEQAINELEALKKRDTPMKLTQSSRFTTDKKLYGMYACNNCHNVVPYLNINNKYAKPNFCYHCGQRLDWGK